MDRLRYTASGRLGLWDSVAGDREEFLTPLVRLLQDNAHAVIEADHIEFIPTDNPALASITAIGDKIIARGNPTLVDLDFEQALMNGPCLPFFRVEAMGAQLHRQVLIRDLVDGPDDELAQSRVDFVFQAGGALGV